MPNSKPNLAAIIAAAKASPKKGVKPGRFKLVGDELLAAFKAEDGEALAKGIRNLMRISDGEETN